MLKQSQSVDYRAVAFSAPQELKQYLIRQDVINPDAQPIIHYSAPNSMCGDFPAGKLCNMAGGFPFEALGYQWRGSEYLYLLGYWSASPSEQNNAIQHDLLSATSGYAAKRYKKNKHKSQARPDFLQWRHEWMLWVVWQKCLGNTAFRELLLATGDALIVEVVERDPVWAAWYNTEGQLVGANAMGKILMLCRDALRSGVPPMIDTAKLNEVGIFILGQRVTL